MLNVLHLKSPLNFKEVSCQTEKHIKSASFLSSAVLKAKCDIDLISNTLKKIKQ